jgi:hypothetical protein
MLESQNHPKQSYDHPTWVTYNILLPGNLRPFWDDSSEKKKNDSRVRENSEVDIICPDVANGIFRRYYNRDVMGNILEFNQEI